MRKDGVFFCDNPFRFRDIQVFVLGKFQNPNDVISGYAWRKITKSTTSLERVSVRFMKLGTSIVL